MNFFSALKIECYKSTKRKTARFLLFFTGLPLFYGIAYKTGSSAVTLEGHFTAVSFCSSCWMLLGYTGMTGILFVIVTANYFGREKEDGQIKFLFLKNRKREEVFLAKYVSVILLIVLLYLGMYVVTTCVFYACIVQTASKGVLCDGINDFITSMTSDFIVLIQIIMIINVEAMLCMYCKSSFCILQRFPLWECGYTVGFICWHQ